MIDCPKKYSEGADEKEREEITDEETEGSCTAVSGAQSGSAPYRPGMQHLHVHRLGVLGKNEAVRSHLPEGVRDGRRRTVRSPLSQGREGIGETVARSSVSLLIMLFITMVYANLYCINHGQSLK
jgi:hypothetical protein